MAATPATRGVRLDLSGVTRTFTVGGQTLPVLRGIDLTLESGSFVAIMGPSGSGKTTLMNVIGLLDRPSSGSYCIGLLDRPSSGSYCMDGQDVGGLSVSARARLRSHSLGYVYQNFNLIARETAQSNVETPLMYQGLRPTQRRERARSALDRVGMADRADHTPAQLSGGQQQRVAIARALAGGAQVLLADEPTGNLDTRTGLQIMALFEALHDEGHTLILVTHSLEIAQHAHRTLHVRDGRIRQDERVTRPRRAAAELAALPGDDA